MDDVMAVIDEPAVARAVDRCLIARSVDQHATTRLHPRPCEWCAFPLDYLRQQLDGFNAWAGWSERARSYERHEVRVWVEWARANQAEAEAQIVAAQGLVGEHGEGGSIPPATPLEKDRPAATNLVGQVQTSEVEAAELVGDDLAAWIP